MDLKKEYGTSKDLENDGVWVSIDDETEVLIARVGNKNYENAMEQLSKPHQRLLQSKRPGSKKKKNEIAQEIMEKVYAKTIILGWKNLYEDGKEVVYSYDECLRMLKEYPDFKDTVAVEAEDINNFFAEEVEEIKENLN